MDRSAMVASQNDRRTIMNNTLGQIIGKVEDNFSVTNDAGETVKLRVYYDFSGMDNTSVKNNLVGSGTRIAFQRPLRKMSASEIKALDGQTFDACTVGRKIVSREEKIAQFKTAFVNAGVSESQASQLAIAAVDNPALLTINKEDNEVE